MGKIVDRTGEIGISNNGEQMKIVRYINNANILVEFQDKHKGVRKTNYYAFKNGSVRNPYLRDVYDVGINDVGNPREDEYLGKRYDYWHSMIRRCHGKIELKRNPTYNEVSICDEWYLFSNFIKWFDDNYYEVENQQMQLDKDILSKGNKIYSPTTCVFVPKSINSLIINGKSNRGKYPIGVFYKEKNKQFCAQIALGIEDGKRKHKHIGLYSTPEDAFYAYKEYKENHIKEVADHYKSQIPQKLYDALYAWEVEITD